MDWNAFIQGPLGAAILGIVALLINRSIKTPKDSERAALIGTLAKDATALVILLYPSASWPELVDHVVRMIAPSAPTENTEVLKRAAASALRDAGKIG